MSKKPLTFAQRTAITRPCEIAEETTDPRFCWAGRGGWSIILTVNVGEE